MAKMPKFVRVRKVDFLKAVKTNYGCKSQTYLTHLFSAIALLLDKDGTGTSLQRLIDDIPQEASIYLPKDDLL